MSRHWKIFIPLLFALAVLLGLVTRKHLEDFSFGSKTSISHFNTPSADSLVGYYQKSQAISQGNNQNQQVSFLAAGDIMLSRNVAKAISEYSVKQGVEDNNFPYLNIQGILKSTDFNFGNLESPFGLGCASSQGGHSLVFKASCLDTEGLNNFGFKIVNLANNHAFDQGLSGLDITKSMLDDAGIAHEGTGDTLDEAWRPAVITVKGIKICFVGASYASVNDGGKATNNYVARMEDTAHLKTAIDQSRKECDFVVATMHGGIEYTRTPNKTQTNFAHAAIDDGADMVIGAHPHWAQTIEKYNGKYIFYSLGNFIFDQNFSQDTKEGLTLKIKLSKSVVSNPQAPGAASLDDLQGGRTPAKLESIELLPVVIDTSQPRPATADESKKILEKIDINETVLH